MQFPLVSLQVTHPSSAAVGSEARGSRVEDGVGGSAFGGQGAGFLPALRGGGHPQWTLYAHNSYKWGGEGSRLALSSRLLQTPYTQAGWQGPGRQSSSALQPPAPQSGPGGAFPGARGAADSRRRGRAEGVDRAANPEGEPPSDPRAAAGADTRCGTRRGAGGPAAWGRHGQRQIGAGGARAPGVGAGSRRRRRAPRVPAREEERERARETALLAAPAPGRRPALPCPGSRSRPRTGINGSHPPSSQGSAEPWG
ncbi:hypothetical protein R6Z07F_008695 [Ovis aries]